MNNDTKHWFAKPLPKHLKFITTLQICADKFQPTSGNAIVYILMALTYSDSKEYNSFQKIAVSNIYFGDEKSKEIQQFFLDRYNNEDDLIDYLNKKITFRYFTRNKNMQDEDTVNFAVKNILNNHLTDFLGEDIF